MQTLYETFREHNLNTYHLQKLGINLGTNLYFSFRFIILNLVSLHINLVSKCG